MFNNLIYMLTDSPLKGYSILSAMVIILLLLIWVSIIDIKRKRIVFWKMIVASSVTILLPLVVSLFCGCGYKKWFLIGAFFLWIGLLYLNVRFNKDRFVGKADVDLLSAVFALNVAFSGWLWLVSDPNVAMIRITHAWYSFFLYLLIGALVYLVFFLLVFTIGVIFGKANFKDLIRGVKISVIPMLMPVSIMVPYMVMVT